MAIHFLGSCDFNKIPTDKEDFLKPYHTDGLLIGKITFRDEDRSKWRLFRETSGTEVSKIQEFLFKAGFMPRGVVDGIFDYVTQSAVRLYQEYLRSIEGFGEVVPDGIVGQGTLAHMQRWQDNNIVSEYKNFSSDNSTKEYNNWFELLEKSKLHYSQNPGPILKYVQKMTETFSTRKTKDWQFNKNDIHLIGIRRNQKQSTQRRENDDLFILLIKGMVFKFWGSTDPSVRMAGRPDEPFLIEGQHLYRYGWHKIFEEHKIYRALKPLDPKGVLVLRDWNDDNAYTDEDLTVKDENDKIKGIRPNNSINIHWSGIGTTNFSAGCQVIAGKSYIDHKDNLQDCSSYASISYSQLNDSKKKTKGAYNVLGDLIVCFSGTGDNKVHYTLGREESLNIDVKFGSQYANEMILNLKSV